ncbi:MAG TPA: NYN domain-containing protein [Pirellulales bacterium]
MAIFAYVDNSNVFIEGKRVSAVALGLALDIHQAKHNNIVDNNWALDFGVLFSLTVGMPADKGRAVMYGSRPPGRDTIWNSAAAEHWEVILHERNRQNQEKQVDVNLAIDLVADSYELMDPRRDTISLVAGDSDFIPAVERVRQRGFTVDVFFWDHASRELKEAASSFTSLNQWVNQLDADPR